jgi:hypothetical protein
LSTQQFVQQHIVRDIIPYVEGSMFPQYLKPLLGANKATQSLWDSKSSTVLKGMLLAEFAKGDPNVSVLLSQSMTLIHSITLLGT